LITKEVFPWEDPRDRSVKLDEGTLLKGKSEREIFKMLGVPGKNLMNVFEAEGLIYRLIFMGARTNTVSKFLYSESKSITLFDYLTVDQNVDDSRFRCSEFIILLSLGLICI